MARGRRRRLADGLLVAVTVGLLSACGSEDRQAPTIADFVLEKAPTGSGDKQVGVAGEPLEQDLRARVTRDGEPVEAVTVYWTTMQGSMNPATDLTDADGISASRWTTEYVYVEQEAFASLEPVRGPRVLGSVLPGMIMFTALASPDPDAAQHRPRAERRRQPVRAREHHRPRGRYGQLVLAGRQRRPQHRAGRRQRPGHLGGADQLSQVPQLQVCHPGCLPLSLCGPRRTGRCRHVGLGDGTAAGLIPASARAAWQRVSALSVRPTVEAQADLVVRPQREQTEDGLPMRPDEWPARRAAMVALGLMLGYFAVDNHVSLYPWNNLAAAGPQWRSALAGWVPGLLTIWALARGARWGITVGAG